MRTGTKQQAHSQAAMRCPQRHAIAMMLSDHNEENELELKNRCSIHQHGYRRRRRSSSSSFVRQHHQSPKFGTTATLPAISAMATIMLFLMTGHVVNGVDGNNNSTTTNTTALVNPTNTTVIMTNNTNSIPTPLEEDVVGQQQDEEPTPECFSHEDCELKFGKGSRCATATIPAASSSSSSSTRKCTNPYYHSSGCLAYHHPKLYQQASKKQRVCSSDDELYLHDKYGETPPCQQPEFDYMEIRLLHQDWVSRK